MGRGGCKWIYYRWGFKMATLYVRVSIRDLTDGARSWEWILTYTYLNMDLTLSSMSMAVSRIDVVRNALWDGKRSNCIHKCVLCVVCVFCGTLRPSYLRSLFLIDWLISPWSLLIVVLRTDWALHQGPTTEDRTSERAISWMTLDDVKASRIDSVTYWPWWKQCDVIN
jgi:hypothetical protein